MRFPVFEPRVEARERAGAEAFSVPAAVLARLIYHHQTPPYIDITLISIGFSSMINPLFLEPARDSQSAGLDQFVLDFTPSSTRVIFRADRTALERVSMVRVRTSEVAQVRYLMNFTVTATHERFSP
tara:strand:- start:24255 stop:24635 length:381 start_codon:yes stop_codon:yes gene_type:complete